MPGDLEIAVNLTMPAHRHGSTLTPSILPLGGGRYQINGLLLHMRGGWQIKISLTAGGAVDEVVIPIVLD